MPFHTGGHIPSDKGVRMLPDTQVWLAHFEYHAQRPRRIPEDVSNVLTIDERRLIAGSLARFQAEKAGRDGVLEAATAPEFLVAQDPAALSRILRFQVD